MSDINMFERASRLRIRYNTPRGILSVEDLWDLPLTTKSLTSPSLDSIAKELNRGVKETETESFVVKAPKANEVLQLSFDVVKHVIEVRMAEAEAAATAKARADQKQELLAIIKEKRLDEKKGKTVEELEAMVAAL